MPKKKKTPYDEMVAKVKEKVKDLEKPRLAKLVNRLTDNDGNKSFGNCMRESGYSDEYSKNPHRLKDTKAYKDTVSPLIANLEEISRLATETIIKKIKKEGDTLDLRALNDSHDKGIKNSRLLKDESTENTKEVIQFYIPDEESA